MDCPVSVGCNFIYLDNRTLDIQLNNLEMLLMNQFFNHDNNDEFEKMQ